LGDCVILNSEYFVVEESSVVLIDGLLSKYGVLISDSSRAKELPELVSVKSTHFKFTDFSKEFLQVIVGDLLLVDVSNLKSSIRCSQCLSLGISLLLKSSVNSQGSLTNLLPLWCGQGFSRHSGESSSFSLTLSLSSSLSLWCATSSGSKSGCWSSS
jgi:hypothetical protein